MSFETTSKWKKNTALFVGGQALSLFGSMLVQYAIVWYVTLQTKSGSMMTAFTVAGCLPTFFISPFGGIWADRYNRKYLINASDALIAAVTLAAALLFIAGYKSVGVLAVCVVIRAFGQGVQTPAVNAFIPQIVPTEHLGRINGIQATVQSTCMLAAPLLSGLLLTFASIELIFFIDVVTALIGIAIVFFFVQTPAPTTDSAPPPGARPSYWQDMKDGINYIRGEPFVRILILLTCVFMLAASPCAFLTGLHIARKFGDQVWRLTLMEITFSAGMMTGGAFITVWGGFKNRVHTMGLSTFLFGVFTIALGVSPNYPAFLVCMGFIGLAMPFYNAPVLVIMQTKVAPEFMGRVFGIFSMVSSLLMPLGMIVYGPLSDVVSIAALLVVTGVALLIMALPFFLSRTLKAAGS